MGPNGTLTPRFPSSGQDMSSVAHPFLASGFWLHWRALKTALAVEIVEAESINRLGSRN